jgi:PAS domain S-box-containing protein
VKDRIVWVNEKCAEMACFNREELMGQSPRIFYESDEAFAAERAKSEASLRKHGTYNGERYTLRQNGERIWVLLAGRCVEDNDPDAGVIWTLLDVTARRQAEDDIRQALERQRELNVLRSRFVAMTSHEFRTPLASILSSAELLRYYIERVSAAERDGMLQSIEAGVQRMTQMLDRILLIGKAEAEMLEFSPKPIDLKELCEQLIKEANRQHADAKSPIVLDWQMPPGMQGLDEKLCRHIFSNLLSNALKYSPEGGDVRMRVHIEKGRTIFEVSDQGIGIPADELHHLFDSFHRASNVGAIAGTGLGLSIVKKSVELHGGTISVSSTIGEGTCFTVTL